MVSIDASVVYCITNAKTCRLIAITPATFRRAHAHGALFAVVVAAIAFAVVAPLRTYGASPVTVVINCGAAMAAVAAVLLTTRPRALL